MRDNGFTLVEMVVALGLFSVMSLAGLGLVEATLGAERRTSMRLDRLADADRTLAMIARDLDAARAPIAGDAVLLQLARRDGGFVRYGLADRQIRRWQGGGSATLADDVASARWRYLGARGWQDRWAEPTPPRAVAIEFSLAGISRVRRIIDLPPP